MKRIMPLFFLMAFVRSLYEYAELPQTPQEYEKEIKKEQELSKPKKPKK